MPLFPNPLALLSILYALSILICLPESVTYLAGGLFGPNKPGEADRRILEEGDLEWPPAPTVELCLPDGTPLGSPTWSDEKSPDKAAAMAVPEPSLGRVLGCVTRLGTVVAGVVLGMSNLKSWSMSFLVSSGILGNPCGFLGTSDVALALGGFFSPSGDGGADANDECLEVQVDGSAGSRACFLVCVGLFPAEVTPTPMPAIDPCLGMRPWSTSSILRMGGGGVLVRDDLGAGLAVRLPSRAAITSSRSSSRAASRLWGAG